jgi:hypothetical protein
MGHSATNHLSSTSFAILKRQMGFLKLLIFAILVFSCFSSIVAAPLDSDAVSVPHAKKDPTPDISTVEVERLVQTRSAGLAWGPIPIGNLKLSLTNPHIGYAGPKFPSANHVNFHVDRKAPKNTYKPVVNLHMVKYSRAKQQCLYAWDSVTGKVVFDSCFDNFGEAIKEGVKAAKGFVEELLKAANWLASFVIIAALVIALGIALTSLGAVVLV